MPGWEYYQHLALLEKNPIKQLFFKMESWRLKKFQKKLSFADKIICISRQDKIKVVKENINTFYVPAFQTF